MHHSLKYLTLDDRALIIESSYRVMYKRNEVVISQGEDLKQALLTISSGIARVTLNGITLIRLGAGAVLGELSLSDRSRAIATVIADTDLGIDVIEGDQLNCFLSSVPGFATRFYASLALVLSQRLRETTSRISTDTNIIPKSQRCIQHTGHLTAEELPTDVVTGIKGFRTEMDSISQILQTKELSSQELKDRVAHSCNKLHHLLTEKISEYPEKALGIGTQIFRESFPYIMLSCTNDRAYTKPFGYSGDYELIDMICTAKPKGDSTLGLLIDEWVLNLPFARSIRERGSRIARLVSEVKKEWQRVVPMPVVYLAIATSRDVLVLLDDMQASSITITCIETDPNAIEEPAKEVKSRDREADVTFVHENVLQINKDNRVFLSPQKVILGSNILDYLEDNGVIEFLDWAYEKLLPDGVVILGQTHEASPDCVYLEHILEWSFQCRGQDTLENLFSRSKFGNEQLNIELEPSGVQIVASCRKQG